jgi:hypothetical protein
MPFNPITGTDDTQDALTQAGFEDPVKPALKPEPDVNGFLDTIAQVESNGGKNLNHPVMRSGIHAGEAAMGRFGLMPNTIKEIANRARLSGQIDPQMKAVAGLEDPSEMKVFIEQHPEVEHMFAEQLAKRLLTKFPNEQEAAYSWNQGHNLTPEAVEKRNYQDADYVKKFNRLKQMLLAGK